MTPGDRRTIPSLGPTRVPARFCQPTVQEMKMPKGYWIARVDVTDDEQYKAYVAANAGPFKAFGARFLVRAGRFENPEGSSRTRNVVIEFPSY